MREGGGWAGAIRGKVSGLSTSLNTIPPPPRLLLPRILNKPAGEGPRGQPGPGGSAFVALSSTVAGRQRGRGRGPKTLSRGLTPRCIVRRGPPPPRGAATGQQRGRHGAPSWRLPPPAARTSRSPDQGPDVESSPQAGSGGAVHSAAPAPSSRRLTPPPGRTLEPPASCERVSVRRPLRDTETRRRPRRATPRRSAKGKPRLRASSSGVGSAGRRGQAGGQRLPGGRGACPRSPAEWRLLCDPSPGCGRQGCGSARSCSCCCSAPVQVGALSSAPVGFEQARVGWGERKPRGGGGVGSTARSATVR